MEIGKKAFLPAVATLCLLAACSEREIKTYKVAKEEKPALPAMNTGAAAEGPHAQGAALPHVHGDIPPGWVEQAPERMRVVSFQIRGENGRLAQMALIPLPGTTGIELQSINMWREELGLSGLSGEQLKSEAQPIEVGGLKGSFFEMAASASRPGEEFKRSTLGAIFERNGVLWFAKMTGEGSLIAEQKDNFKNYLKSLEFHDPGAHGETAVASTPGTGANPPESSERPVSANAGKIPPDSSLPRWNAPSNWKEKTPGPMLTAAYSVNSDAGQADVTISRLGGEGGGLVANVNRWRGQLGLAPLGDAEIQKSVTMLEVDGKKTTYLADLKGTNARTGKAARLIAAGVPRGGETWFYKLMGDEAAVEKEKDTFVKFITSAY